MMAPGRLQFLKEVLRPRVVRAASALLFVIAAWDATSNQFGLPKIPALWGMSGSLLPWWGWLLVAQAALVWALFEYVRLKAAQHERAPQPTGAHSDPAAPAAVVDLTEEERGGCKRALGELFDYVAQDIVHLRDRFRERLNDRTGVNLVHDAGALREMINETEARLQQLIERNRYAFRLLDLNTTLLLSAVQHLYGPLQDAVRLIGPLADNISEGALEMVKEALNPARGALATLENEMTVISRGIEAKRRALG